MSLFRKFFGRKSSVPEPPPPAADPSAPSDPAQDPNLIRVHDAYGREMFITKQQWRDNVLLGHIEKVWNQPDELYGVIVQSLQDGFGADMIKPAEQLARIDPQAERGAVVLAIVYREQKRLDDSERVLRRHIERHGESGVILTNLAKVHADRGQHDLSLQTLWRGLELDPNQENGLGWYTALFQEKEGGAGYLASLRRLAALPGSWRARLWLARDALGRRQLEEALALYDETFARAPHPVPTDLLQQLSGDLGNHGHLVELLRLTEQHFQVGTHGLAVGNNLLKASLDLGRLDAVQALLDLHYAQKRPDWKETLSFWDAELAKARLATASTPPAGQLKVQLLSGDGPVWLQQDSAAGELFPTATDTPTTVAFLGSTHESIDAESSLRQQVSDDQGRITRALPLFLAEQVHFRTRARVRPLTPWMEGSSPAFVVSGVPWSDNEAARHARAEDPPSDYIVVSHLKPASDPWRVQLRLIRTIDARCLGELEGSLSPSDPAAGLLPLVDQLLSTLTREAELLPHEPPRFYRLPDRAFLGHYLVRLEQLLAARCAGREGVSPSFLHGVRDIIDAHLDLCLRHPDNVVTRIILAQTLRALRWPQPRAVADYRDKVALLQREHPLPPAAQGVTQRLLAEVYP